MVKLGVIGCGHWGPNHIRIFSSLNNSEVTKVADLSRERLNSIKANFPHVEVTEDFKALINDSSIDAVLVATPTKTHYEIVKASLEASKHVFCEKPLCVDAKEGSELVKLAKEKNLTLMVGHIFLFNAGIKSLKKMLDEKSLGNLHYLTATRTNLGPVRQDVNAVYDLATHDISIFNYLLGSKPEAVSAIGMSYLNQPIEDVSFLSLKYPGGVLGNIHVSWLDPKKVREITLVGDKKMATWDDLGDMGPITIYDKGIVKGPSYYDTFGQFQLLAREGDITIPKIKMVEPLRSQDEHFLDCIINQTPCVSDGLMGNDIVHILQATDLSMKENGKMVPIEYS